MRLLTRVYGNTLHTYPSGCSVSQRRVGQGVYGVPFVSKFITGERLESTVGIYGRSGHLRKSQWTFT